MNNKLEGINRKINEAEEQINDLEDKMVEITATGQKKEWKEMKMAKETYADNIKCTNIWITRVPEGEEGEEKDLKKYLKR